MPKMTVVKEITFEAAHHLRDTGKCSNLHGHSYKLQVGIEGEVKKGMIMNFSDLKEILNKVHEEFDHDYTNRIIEYPSAENMVVYIMNMVKKDLPSDVQVKFIRLWETATSYVEYYGE